MTPLIEIVLEKVSSRKKYNIIPLPRRHRPSFPGFKVEFELQTDVGLFKVKVVGDSAKLGDPAAGNYITGKLGRWYEKHPELKDGTIIIISVIEPMRRYELSIK